MHAEPNPTSSLEPGGICGVVQTERSITAVLGMDVTLPCYYQAEADEKVAQVVWIKKGINGQNTEIVILNTEYGANIFGAYEGRVKEKAPLESADGGIILKNAVQADEGTYQCRVNTFPAGNFDAELELKVLVPPLPTLSPGPPLIEGEGRSLAASCTAEGNPAPALTWETGVEGTNLTKKYEHQRSASVTSEFYVVPTRRMNGKVLTCVVSHPGFQQEKRITHVLGVRYLAEISVQGHEEGLFAGKEGAMLQCQADGNPPPTYTWSRTNGSLPAEIKTEGNTLQFLRGLAPEDAGVYVCHATNGIGSKSAQATVSIAEYEARKIDLVSVSLGSVGVLTAILLVVLVITLLMVNRHHKKRTKQLSEKIEELSTLSREASRRRLNSTTASTDTRLQLEEGIHLRSGMHCDSLRDPSISSMMGEEADRRSYSTLTTLKETETQTELLSTVPDEEAIEDSEETEQVEQSKEKEQNPTEADGIVGVAIQPFIKQGMAHFYQENGTLRAKPSANGIYINGRGHLV
ncbi:nectin-4 isoform X2 [Xenopus laevis]|uniref:Nectin-4 isoform X2 n=1 Tax=Xenopus laevis TaxID=8355 RepID=A0A8J0TI92_XENLA|nr:nectin-4 isoform X2 [Xenopus laevis]